MYTPEANANAWSTLKYLSPLEVTPSTPKKIFVNKFDVFPQLLERHVTGQLQTTPDNTPRTPPTEKHSGWELSGMLLVEIERGKYPTIGKWRQRSTIALLQRMEPRWWRPFVRLYLNKLHSLTDHPFNRVVCSYTSVHKTTQMYRQLSICLYLSYEHSGSDHVKVYPTSSRVLTPLFFEKPFVIFFDINRPMKVF